MRFQYSEHKIVNLNDLGFDFEYRPDVIIGNMTPRAVNYYHDARDWNGAIIITGQHMDSIALPFIGLKLNNSASEGSMSDSKKYFTDCSVKNSSSWFCPIPNAITGGEYNVYITDQVDNLIQSSNLTLTVCPPPHVESFLYEPVKITEIDPKFDVKGQYFCHDVAKTLVTKNNMTLCQKVDVMSNQIFTCHLNLTHSEWFLSNEIINDQLVVYIEGKYFKKI